MKVAQVSILKWLGCYGLLVTCTVAPLGCGLSKEPVHLTNRAETDSDSANQDQSNQSSDQVGTSNQGSVSTSVGTSHSQTALDPATKTQAAPMILSTGGQSNPEVLLKTELSKDQIAEFFSSRGGKVWEQPRGPLPPGTGIAFAGNSFTKADLRHVNGFEVVCSLELPNVKISAESMRILAGLSCLKELEYLQTLKANEITDAHLKEINRFSDLRFLNLDSSQVTDAGLLSLDKLERLSTLTLRDAPVRGVGLSALKGSPLGTLQLRRSSLSNDGMKHLGQLTRLHDLDVSNTAIGDEGIRQLVNLKGLSSLNLSNTQVTGASLRHLGELPNLKTLDLSDTQISDVDLDQLIEIMQLEFVYVTNTQITETGELKLKTALSQRKADRRQ